MTGEYMAPETEFKYAAFISYRHKPLDKKWANWLVNTLEKYKVPSELIKAGFPEQVGKVYRDEDEFSAAPDLHKHITEALDCSNYLIVICSPDTPHSKWVDQEINYFRSLGRGDHILALLVDGEPEESFPEALWLTDKNGERVEPAAADVRKRPDQRQKETRDIALMRIISGIVGCGFDDLRNRQKLRSQRQKFKAMMAGIFVALIISTLFGLQQLQTNKIQAEALRQEKNTSALIYIDTAEEMIKLKRTQEAMQLSALGLEGSSNPSIDYRGNYVLDTTIAQLESQISTYLAPFGISNIVFLGEQGLIVAEHKSLEVQKQSLLVWEIGEPDIKREIDVKYVHLISEKYGTVLYTDQNDILTLLDIGTFSKIPELSQQQQLSSDDACIFLQADKVFCVVTDFNSTNIEVTYDTEDTSNIQISRVPYEIIEARDGLGLFYGGGQKISFWNQTTNKILSSPPLKSLGEYSSWSVSERDFMHLELLMRSKEKYLIWNMSKNSFSKEYDNDGEIIQSGDNYFMNNFPFSYPANNSVIDPSGEIHINEEGKLSFFTNIGWKEAMEVENNELLTISERYNHYKKLEIYDFTQDPIPIFEAYIGDFFDELPEDTHIQEPYYSAFYSSDYSDGISIIYTGAIPGLDYDYEGPLEIDYNSKTAQKFFIIDRNFEERLKKHKIEYILQSSDKNYAVVEEDGNFYFLNENLNERWAISDIAQDLRYLDFIINNAGVDSNNQIYKRENSTCSISIGIFEFFLTDNNTLETIDYVISENPCIFEAGRARSKESENSNLAEDYVREMNVEFSLDKEENELTLRHIDFKIPVPEDWKSIDEDISKFVVIDKVGKSNRYVVYQTKYELSYVIVDADTGQIFSSDSGFYFNFHHQFEDSLFIYGPIGVCKVLLENNAFTFPCETFVENPIDSISIQYQGFAGNNLIMIQDDKHFSIFSLKEAQYYYAGRADGAYYVTGGDDWLVFQSARLGRTFHFNRNSVQELIRAKISYAETDYDFLGNWYDMSSRELDIRMPNGVSFNSTYYKSDFDHNPYEYACLNHLPSSLQIDSLDRYSDLVGRINGKSICESYQINQ